jgi:DNA replication protein DnaC
MEMDMLLEPTLDKLNAMKLFGMAEGLRRFAETTDRTGVAPQELIAMLADAEWLSRENRALSGRLRRAAFRISTCVEDIDYAVPRGLSKPLMLELASSRWVKGKKNIIITGPAGAGKSHLACALGNKACRDGFSVLYRRSTRLLDELAQARADGSMPVLLRRYAKVNALIIDDFGPTTLSANERRDLLEVLDDRYDISATVFTSQLEPSLWHAVIGDVTTADSICDRLVHNAHRIKLTAKESVRKDREKKQRLTEQTESAK